MAEPLNLCAFNGRDLQNLHSFLTKAERAGYDIRPLRTAVYNYFERQNREQRFNKREPDVWDEKPLQRPDKQKTVIKQSTITCPDCQEGYLQVKQLEGVTYTACPQCTKSVEFK